MLIELQEIENIWKYKIQVRELKNTIIELKNTLEERISELKNWAGELTQSELKDLQDIIIKQTNICNIGVPEGEDRKGGRKLSWRNNGWKPPLPGEGRDIQVQEAQSSRDEPRDSHTKTPAKDKDRTLSTAKEKKLLMYTGTPINYQQKLYFAGQKGVAQCIKSAWRKKHATKNTLPDEAVIHNAGESFPDK